MHKSIKPVLVALAAAAASAASAAPSFTTSTFALPPVGASGPDSVTVAAGSVWVSYDGASLSSDGSQPAGFSTVARYSTSGTLQSTYQVAGDVDGLKFNPATAMMWAVQNQDANSHVTLIDPVTHATQPLSFAVTSQTQGIDDLVFSSQGTFLSVTNPGAPGDTTLAKVTGTAPTIQTQTIATAGQAGLNIVTGMANFVPAIVNTDSLKLAPNGDLVQTTGNRDTLLFIHGAGSANPSFSYLALTAQGKPVKGLDDSLYLTSSSGRIFAALSSAGAGGEVMEIDYSGVTPGTLVASIGSLNELGLVDPSTGNVTPLVTGLAGIHGLDVIAAVPEPSTYAMLCAGLVGMIFLQRRKR